MKVEYPGYIFHNGENVQVCIQTQWVNHGKYDFEVEAVYYGNDLIKHGYTGKVRITKT